MSAHTQRGTTAKSKDSEACGAQTPRALLSALRSTRKRRMRKTFNARAISRTLERSGRTSGSTSTESSGCQNRLWRRRCFADRFLVHETSLRLQDGVSERGGGRNRPNAASVDIASLIDGLSSIKSAPDVSALDHKTWESAAAKDTARRALRGERYAPETTTVVAAL